MTVETHFVLGGDGPILVGTGPQVLTCGCGNVLVQGFEPKRFLAIGIQCGRCGATTVTDPLPEGDLPPRSAIIASPSLEPRTTPMMVPVGVSVVGQSEMARLQLLFQPNTPDGTYQVSDAFLDEASALFAQHTGGELPEVAQGEAPWAGLRDHPLAWAVRHLRGLIRSASWSCMGDSPTAIAVTHVAGFVHFVRTWSRHPLLPAMMATAGERGFSQHGLAPFATAHCLAMMGNRISFPEPMGYPGRIEWLELATEQGYARVFIDPFDRFEFPFGQNWDHLTLRPAVHDAMTAAQGRVNLRHPGMLVLSPGSAPPGFDEALVEAVKTALLSVGRKNRGLIGAAPIVLRLQGLSDPHAVRFGYGLFPVGNRHYRGEIPVQVPTG